MPVVGNPMAVNPFSPIAAAMSNLTKTLLSGPTPEERAAKEAQRTLYAAQTEHSRAQTAKLQQELSAANTINQAVQGLYALPDPIAYPETQTFDAPPDMVPIRQSRDAQIAQFMPDLWKGVAQTGKMGDIGSVIRAAVANAPGSSDNAVIRAMAGAGDFIGKDQAVSEQGQANIREGNFAADYRKAMDEALLKERGLNDRAAMTDALSLVQVIGEDNVPRWTQKSQAVGGRAPATGAQPTPRNYMTPDGGQGLTFDGRTDAQSGAVLPQGVQIITKGVQAPDVAGVAPKLTEVQSKSTLTLARAQQAEQDLEALTAGGYDPTRVMDARNLPAPGVVPGAGAARNLVMSPEAQQFENAGRAFVSAVLRPETGAAVTDQEWQMYGPMFWPQVGDTPETLAQKKQLRAVTLNAIKMTAGPGGAPRPGAAPSAAGADPMEGRTATNPQTGEKVIRRNGQWVPAQ